MSLIFSQILEKDRRLRVNFLNTRKSPYFNEYIYSRLGNYFDDYCAYYAIDSQRVIMSYNNFVSHYMTHLKKFDQLGEYPYESSKDPLILNRIDYDIALILSILLEPVRHQIFNNVLNSYKIIENKARILFVGIGPGIELELLPDELNKIEAYDLEIAEFPKKRFVKFNLKEELFDKELTAFDNIYCIELLEHIPNPELLVKNLSDSLKPGGNLYLTTASNMPQFDHMINFHDRPFDNSLEEMSLEIIKKVNFMHGYNGKNSESYNTWYSCKKR